MKLSNDRKVLIADIEMYDAAIYGAPPAGVQVLCCNAKLGTTVKGIFNPTYHDCWYPLPRIPMSAKKRAYGMNEESFYLEAISSVEVDMIEVSSFNDECNRADAIEAKNRLKDVKVLDLTAMGRRIDLKGIGCYGRREFAIFTIDGKIVLADPTGGGFMIHRGSRLPEYTNQPLTYSGNEIAMYLLERTCLRPVILSDIVYGVVQ